MGETRFVLETILGVLRGSDPSFKLSLPDSACTRTPTTGSLSASVRPLLLFVMVHMRDLRR